MIIHRGCLIASSLKPCLSKTHPGFSSPTLSCPVPPWHPPTHPLFEEVSTAHSFSQATLQPSWISQAGRQPSQYLALTILLSQHTPGPAHWLLTAETLCTKQPYCVQEEGCTGVAPGCDRRL